MIIDKFNSQVEKTKVGNLPKLSKKYTIHNVQIIDASGSMFYGKKRVDGVLKNKYEAARDALDMELNDLKSEKRVNYTFTAVEFTSGIGEGRGIESKVKFLAKRDIPASVRLVERIEEFQARNTPLWDAIGYTLTELLKATKGTDEKALIQIWTDGGENGSTYFTPAQINDLIKECEERQFTVTFGGTPEDIRNVKLQLSNLDEGNFVAYSSVADEMNQNFGASRGARSTYTAMAATGNFQTKGFFKEVVKTTK